MKKILGKLRIGLGKTRRSLVDGVARAVGERKRIDTELLDRMEEILIAADVGVDSAERVTRRLTELSSQGDMADTSDITALLQKEMVNILVPEDTTGVQGSPNVHSSTAKPHVIMVVGVNGTGKTTTIGKLAHKFKLEGKRVLVAAADTFRAAATEQLEIWAKRAGADIVKTQPGADPAAVAYDSIDAAIARDVDVLIVDTAGRLHTKVNLMEELRKIHRVLGKRLPGAPHEVLLVLDATTGQNGLSQARQFTEATGITGIVITKLEGTAKGGIVVAIRQELGIPVKYVGLGEGLGDLQEFDPEEFVEALFE